MFPQIEDLFLNKHRPSPERLRQLDDEQFEALRRASLGEVSEADRRKAITLLSIARPREAYQTLSEVLTSPEQDGRARVIAAYQLGRYGEEAEHLLLEVLPTVRDDQLRIGIIQSLARVGRIDAIQLLKDQIPYFESTIQRLALFSQAVIAYRLGEEGYDLPIPPEPLAGNPQRRFDLRIQQATQEELEQILPWLEGDTLGMQLSRRLSYQIDCIRTFLLLSFDQQLEEMPANALVGRRRLAGLIANRAEEDGSYSTRYLLFTTPEGHNSLAISIYSMGGAPAYIGKARRDGNNLTFKISATSGAGAALTTLTGVFSADGVDFKTAWSDAVVTPRRTPSEIIPPQG